MRLMRKNQKKYLKIYEEYRSLVADGSPAMEVYKVLAKKHRKSVGGIRYAIKSVEDMLRPVAPPLSDEEMRMGILTGSGLTISKNQI